MSSQQDPSTYWSRAEGMSPGQAISSGLTAWILSIWGAWISGFQQVFEFLFIPFDVFIDIVDHSVANFILEPMGIISAGADITSAEIDVFGIFALPASVALALGTLLVVVLYLQLGITSNIFPGLFLDNRIVSYLFTTPEEESAGED